MKLSILPLAVLFCYFSFDAFGQQTQSEQHVFTSDIDRFWVAYDSAQTTTDSLQQMHFLQTLYVDKGTPGLKAFMVAREYSAAGWVGLIRQNPKFWRSIRPNTLTVSRYAGDIESSIRRFKQLYPPLTDAKMYFTIGGLKSGGTTKDSLVLIGAEIATGGPGIDVSEPNTKWLAPYFEHQDTGTLVRLNVHEYVHTQQRAQDASQLLGKCLQEGAADFITELVMDRPLRTSYILYGMAHETALKTEFATDMFSGSTLFHWMYNSRYKPAMVDLGYFMGYAICGAYYRQATDKSKAIRDIIQLKYDDTTATDNFLKQSGYIPEPYDKAAWLYALAQKLPAVTGVGPFTNGDSTVDPSLTEMTIRFSLPMEPNNKSINYGPGGKDGWPITGVSGYAADNRVLKLAIKLQPGHDYEFIFTGGGFRSTDGYSLQPYTVHFRTRP